MAKLYHPDGRPYETSDKTEIVRLKAAGYTEADPTPPKKKTPSN